MGTGILFMLIGYIAIVAPEIFLTPLRELFQLDDRSVVQPVGVVLCFVAIVRAGLWIARRIVRRTSYTRSEIATLGASGLGIAVAGDRGDPETMPTRARHEAAHAVVALAYGMTVHSANILMRGRVGGQVHWSAPDTTLTAPAEGLWARIVIGLAGMAMEHSEGVHGPGPDDDIQNAMLCAMKIICIGRRPLAYPSGGLTVEGIITGATTEAVRILDLNAAAVDRIQTMLLEGNTTGLRSADLADIDVVRA